MITISTQSKMTKVLENGKYSIVKLSASGRFLLNMKEKL